MRPGTVVAVPNLTVWTPNMTATFKSPSKKQKIMVCILGTCDNDKLENFDSEQVMNALGWEKNDRSREK